jgi:signal transduction histidine kinase
MKRLSFGSVYLRFNLSHLTLWLASIFIISVFIGFALYSTSFFQIQQQLNTLASIASNLLEENLLASTQDAGSRQAIAADMEMVFASDHNLEWTIFNQQGIPIVGSREGSMNDAITTSDPEIGDALTNTSGRSQQTRENSTGQHTLYLAARVEKDGQILGVVRLEYPVISSFQAVRKSIISFFILVAVITVLVGGMSVLTAKSLTKPIESITRTADQIANGDLNARAEISDRSPEMAYLGQAFNQMADRLKVHVSELRSFVSNASHELRTPLTVIKLRIEALRNGAMDEPEVANRFLAEVESEVDRLSRMVGDMLDLSRIEAGLNPSQSSLIDLGNIICDVRDTMKVRAERANIEVICEIEKGLPPVMGAEDQLRRMLYNLVDNSIKYTTRGGRVELSCRLEDQTGMLLLTIKDTGFGISAEQLPHIFERFFRVEATRPRYGPPQGSGLGLSIAKSIVEIHGGKIRATSELGKGTTFFIELPAAIA